MIEVKMAIYEATAGAMRRRAADRQAKPDTSVFQGAPAFHPQNLCEGVTLSQDFAKIKGKKRINTANQACRKMSKTDYIQA